eukprot:982877-Pyramimonas_sp.AAC.2
MEGCCVKGETKPELRMSAMFNLFKPNQLMLYGGVNEGNKSLNSMYVLDTQKMEWTKLYRADPDLCPPGAPIAASLVNGTLFAMNMNQGSVRYDAVQSVDPLAIAEKYGFVKFMTDIIETDLERMEKQMDHLTSALALTEDPVSLAANFKSLLKVMGGLFDIKQIKNETDLLLDQVRAYPSRPPPRTLTLAPTASQP